MVFLLVFMAWCFFMAFLAAAGLCMALGPLDPLVFPFMALVAFMAAMAFMVFPMVRFW